jgi:hypothetical protein
MLLASAMTRIVCSFPRGGKEFVRAGLRYKWEEVIREALGDGRVLSRFLSVFFCGYFRFLSREENRMKRLIILALVVSFMVVSAGIPAAFAGKAKTSTGSTTLQGTLEKQGSDYVITSGKTSIPVVGDGLADLVGKKVIANGKMNKTEKGKVFQAEKIQEQIGKKK